MAELKKVRLDQIEANPFRNLDEWPTLRDKVEELKTSIGATGFWEGYMIVRKQPGFTDKLRRQPYEQAFGHHRLVALREAFGSDHMITVNVQKLDDNEMFAMMVGENSETYGQQFYYSVMQPIASLIKAYGAGVVEMEKPETGMGAQKHRWCLAPSFLPGSGRDVDGGVGVYTAATVARYLKWINADPKRKNDQPHNRVLIALSALELIEKGALAKDSLKGLNQSQVSTTIKALRLRMQSERADIDSTLSVKTDALEKAAKNGDTNKVTALTKEIEAIEGRADAKALKAGQSAAKEIAAIFNPPSAGDIFDAGAPPEAVPTKATKTATQATYDYLAKVEGFALDSHKVWDKVGDASPKAREELIASLLRLAERAKNRAKEIK